MERTFEDRAAESYKKATTPPEDQRDLYTKAFFAGQKDAIEMLNAKNKLLREAYNRFKQYEMDVDDHPPRDHIEFMKKLRAEIDA